MRLPFRKIFLATLMSGVFSVLSLGQAVAQDTSVAPETGQSLFNGASGGVSLPGDTLNCSNPTDVVSSLASNLLKESSCWSCQLYGSVYKGMHTLVHASYDKFVDQSTGGILLVVTILSCALVMRILPFLTTTRGEYEMIAGLRMFFFRIVAVFSLVLLVPASTALGGGGLVSDFVIDGPLAIGTSIGEVLSTSTMRAFPTFTSSADGGSMTSLFGSAWSLEPTSSNADMLSFQNAHIAGAQTLLFNMHELGSVGIVVSAWLLLDNSSSDNNQSSGVSMATYSAALYMLFVFFKFTFSFGLQYIDALVRSMIIFSLIPVFAVLWIFDCTRPMAVQAVRSSLALAGVFAASGAVYSIAFFIMYYGYKNAFQNQMPGLSNLAGMMCGVNKSVVSSLFVSVAEGSSNVNTVNWMSFFYLVGSATLATACARLPLEVSQEIFAFGGSEMGLARSVSENMGDAVQKGLGALRK